MKKFYYLSLILLGLSSCSDEIANETNETNQQNTTKTAAAGTALSRLTFDWTTVPSGADIGDTRRLFSPSEINFLAKKYSVLSIEKVMGGYKQADGRPDTEKGFLETAKALKAANPKVAVLYYWNSLVYYNYYKGMDANFKEADWTRTVYQANGEPYPINRKHYNLDNAEFRKWWVAQAVAMAKNPEVDGIFVDALGAAYNIYSNKKYALNYALTLIRQLRAGLNTIPGTPKLIFFNVNINKVCPDGFTEANGTLSLMLRVADGAFMEEFNVPGRAYNKETAIKILKGMQFAARNNKAVIFSTFPSFAVTPSFDTPTYLSLIEKSRKEIDYPLAAFLVSAGKYSYFQYSYGYNRLSPGSGIDHGLFVRTEAHGSTVNPEWYNQLRRALGAPKEDAVITGQVWRRKFANATVTLDLRTTTPKGTIVWNTAATFYPKG
ncbi:hypothetical protein GON26_20195 [Flavobacterium sp. GA093]|uniref:Uncharacterized protein n=1 Tax=Flavobacterium hydrocarbonoxydans TaxID=2683249 RepID=A0A6I4NRE4_9FLAO|nr:putative glycoside hydrolase [Flavobacterium hydrocarbonoxydans]MWB96691.1 hypothetical protein [Flavobacterium hydrocarbonoxydans]